MVDHCSVHLRYDGNHAGMTSKMTVATILQDIFIIYTVLTDLILPLATENCFLPLWRLMIRCFLGYACTKPM
jgi:hypothetical protein